MNPGNRLRFFRLPPRTSEWRSNKYVRGSCVCQEKLCDCCVSVTFMYAPTHQRTSPVRRILVKLREIPNECQFGWRHMMIRKHRAALWFIQSFVTSYVTQILDGFPKTNYLHYSSRRGIEQLDKHTFRPANLSSFESQTWCSFLFLNSTSWMCVNIYLSIHICQKTDLPPCRIFLGQRRKNWDWDKLWNSALRCQMEKFTILVKHKFLSSRELSTTDHQQHGDLWSFL